MTENYKWQNTKLRELAEKINIFFPAKLRAQYIETLEDADDHYALFHHFGNKHRQSKLRLAARNAVRYAIRTGQLERPESCSECGQTADVQAHHDDYEKPLEVRWLCLDCHLKTRTAK